MKEQNQRDFVVADLKNNNKYQILTDMGWSDFSGVQKKGSKPTIKIQTENSEIKVTPDHEIYTEAMIPVAAENITPEHKIIAYDGLEQVKQISHESKPDMVFDIIGVDKNNRFIANNLLVSNCEFIVFDETLISSLKLAKMKGVPPIEKQGQIRWYQRPKKKHMYVVALDPSLGTGGDNAAIEVYELPSMIQVAEWQHNKTPIQQQVAIMSKITEYIVDMIGVNNDVYYSVENNSLGEAALVTIAEMGEENMSGIFLSERKQKGKGRKFRRGFTTTNQSKLAACAKTKSLIESDRLIINSDNLISELKNYIAVGSSYEAKVGETDDLVSATLLAVRMAQTLQAYDPNLDATLRDKIDSHLEPMPFIVI